MSEILSREEYSRTSAVLGMEFDACSTAAREANEVATQLLTDKRHAETLHLIQDPEAGSAVEGKFDVVDLNPAIPTPLKHDKDVIRLKLIQSRRVNGKRTPLGSYARLVAVLHDDLAVPLASFARRNTASGCDHVQIEDEQHDENYVILPRDRRSQTVRAMTAFMKNTATIEQEQLIYGMAQRSLARNAERINEECGPVLARSIFRRMQTPRPKVYDRVCVPTEDDVFSRNVLQGKLWSDQLSPAFHRPVELPDYIGSYSAERSLSLLRTGVAQEADMLINYVHNGYMQLEDGRPVRLAFVAEEYTTKHVPYGRYNVQNGAWLTAVTRGNVAVPLVRFSADGKVQEIDIDGSLNALPLQDILLLFKTAGLTKDTDQEEEVLQEIQDIVVESTLQNPRLLGRAMMSMYFRRRSNQDVYVRGFLRHARKSPPNPLDGLLKKLETQEANGFNRTTSLRIVKRFDAQSRFNEVLGKYDSSEDTVLQAIGKLAEKGSRFTGRLEKFPVNGEETDVDVFAEVTEENGGHRLTIRGRPSIYRERRPSVLYDTFVHPAQELGLEPDEVIDIQRLLNSVSVRVNKLDGGKVISTEAPTTHAIWEA